MRVFRFKLINYVSKLSMASGIRCTYIPSYLWDSKVQARIVSKRAYKQGLQDEKRLLFIKILIVEIPWFCGT